MRLFLHNKDQADFLHIDARPWDIMQYAQYAIQKRHDGQVRCAVFFKGNLDLNNLKRAVLLSMDLFPELCGRYILDDKLPYWRIPKAPVIEDVFSTVITNCMDDEAVSFLPERTDPLRGPQIRFRLVRGQARDTLCILVNRMAFDEAGLKEYLYLLGQIYTNVHSMNFSLPQLDKQSMRQFLHTMPLLPRLKAMYHRGPLLEIPPIDQIFPLSHKEEIPFIVTHTLPVSRYQTLARYAVHRHVKMEEVLLTGYIRAVYVMLSEKFGIPFPFLYQADLRRFLPWGEGRTARGFSLPILFVAPAQLPGNFHETLTMVHERLARLQEPRAVLENAKALGAYPFSAKKMQEHRMLPDWPYYSFNHIGTIDSARLGFGNVGINDVYITGPVCRQPCICLNSTVFEDSLTFSCNLAGNRDDWATCKYFLATLVRELPATV